MRAVWALGVLATAAVLLPFLVAPAGAVAIDATVQGPRALAPSQLAQYNVTVLGVPAGTPVNYTIVYYIAGSSVTGGSPASSTPGRTVSTTSPVRVNVTAPVTEQSLTLTVQVSAKLPTQTVNVTKELTITVVRPISLTATFHNASSTAAVNVTVRFFVDNVAVGTSRIKRIAANSDGTASTAYLPVGLQPGEHTVRAEADLNGDGIIDPSLGEVVTSTIFYESVPAQSAGWSVLLGIAVFIPVFLGVVVVRRRSRS